MDISRTYDLETSHQLTLGYSDAEANYSAQLITVEPNPKTVWSYKPPETYLQSELKFRPLEVMLAFAQEAVRLELDGKTFVLPDNEYERLNQAPSILPMKATGLVISDTDYAERLQAQQIARQRAQQAVVLRELLTVAEILEDWQTMMVEDALNRSQQNLLACSVSELVIRSDTLGALLEWDELAALAEVRADNRAHDDRGMHYRLDSIISPRSLESLNTFIAEHTGGISLLEFPSVVEAEGGLASILEERLEEIYPLENAEHDQRSSHGSDIATNTALAWHTGTASNNDQDPDDETQERADALAELEHCVFELVNLRDYERGEIEDIASERSIEQRRSNLLAQTASMLASNAYAIASQLSPSTFTTMANSDGLNDWDIYTLLDERELSLINNYCESLCRTRLTDFPLAVQRGYNPTNGVPLEHHPNSEQYNRAALFPSPQTERTYQQFCGMTEEQAAEAVRILRLDLRDRTEADWNFL